MNTAMIPVYAIQVGERRRRVNPYVVDDLRKSIEQSGLLQNIGVVQDGPDTYRLVFGAHRLEAVIELEWQEIPALVFPEGTPDEEVLLAEIQENYTRNELTGAERKAFAADVGRLSQKLQGQSNQDDQSNFDQRWLIDLANKSGLKKQTAYNWWSAFCRETGLTITPKQASDENRHAFFAWLDEQKTREEAEKARKEEEQAAEKARIELKKREATRDKALSTVLETLLFLNKEYGFDSVLQGVIQPFMAVARKEADV